MDIEQIRRDTPGLADGRVHLLAAGSALMPQPVLDAVLQHLQLEAEHGGYEAHALAAESLDALYPQVAALIGARAHEIAITEHATAAWCQAFYALPLKAGQRILTCEAEYAANYVALLQRAQRDGVRIEVVPSTASGELDLEALEATMDSDVGLIATTWIPTNGGLVNPSAAIGRIAQQHDVPFLLDACQALGQMPVDVQALGCDFLSATGRKFLRGPRGTGFLYVREKWLNTLEPVMLDHFAAPWVGREQYRLREDARRFEHWENAYALRAGLKAAVEYAQRLGLEAIQQRAWALATQLRQALGDMPHAACQDIGDTQCAIVSFSLEHIEPREAVQKLREQQIFIGASSPSSTRLDAERRQLPTLLRAAPHYYNSEADIQRLVDGLNRLSAQR